MGATCPSPQKWRKNIDIWLKKAENSKEMANSAPERGPLAPKSPEGGKVLQPISVGKIDGLSQILEAVQEIGKIAETMGEDTSARDAGAGGGFRGSGTASTTFSVRDRAIANLPDPRVMQKQLEQHIRGEVKKLRRQAKRVARIGSPGAAYHLTKIYARIRQFNTLLSALFEASVDVLKRFFIRVFIDRQPIL